jgi:Aspartyl/Asparaginyl beta-hydroxylase
MRCLRLPFTFDPARLAADLARVAPAEWIPHVNRHDYAGQWSGAALRSIAGAAGNIIPDAHGTEAFADTALLARCPYFREALAAFRCPLQAVRLLRLHAGSRIAEHVDHALDFEDGEVRLHIPIATSEQVKFHLDGARLLMAPGECWYTNVNLPHAVDNEGCTDRIHLVIDCRVDAWLREVFAATPRPPPDHYAAAVRLPGAPTPAAWMEFLSAAAAIFNRPEARVSFRSEGAVQILSWRAAHTWQLRLRLADADARKQRGVSRRGNLRPRPGRNRGSVMLTAIGN